MLYSIMWALLTLLIFVSLDIIFWRMGKKGIIRLIATFIFGISQIILSQFLLGLFGGYTRTGVFLLNLAIICAVMLLSYHNQKDFMSAYRKSFLSNAIKMRKQRIPASLFVVGALVMVIVTWVGFVGVIYPPTDFDGNAYHLTAVGYMLQEGDIYDVDTSLPWLNGYPKFGELLQSWLLLMTGRDVLVDMAQIPFAIVGAISLYAISVRLGASKRNSALAAMLLLTTPILINQLKTTYVDVIMAMVFFMSIAVICAKHASIRFTLLLLGFCYGLLLSLKFTGIVFVLGSLIYFLVVERQRYWHWPLKSSLLMKDFAVLLIGIVPASYWYIKNIIVYDSPLHPFGVKLLGHSIFPGKTFQEFADAANSTVTALPDGYFSRIWFVWTEQKDWYGCMYNYDTNFAGLGPVWFVFMLPSIVFALYFAIKNRNTLLLMLFGIIGAMFAVYPANYYARYTLFVLLIGIVSFAYTLTHLRSYYARMLTVGLLVVTIISVMFTNVTLCNFSPSTLRDGLRSFRAGNYHEAANYQLVIGSAYAYIQQSAQKDDVVVYDSSPYYIYPLWNRDYSNDVIYLASTNEEDWERDLSTAGADYVFTQKGSKEHEWLEDGEGEYKTVYEDIMYEVYKR